MNLFDFAQKILDSPNIEDKLSHPGRPFFSQKKFSGALPVLPKRSPEFSFGRKKAKEIPNGELKSDRDRGLMLLFFMNHELMAIELMALALLRFSHCTTENFQRGLLQTLIDEQKHCRLYLKRFKELGCEAGEIPLSRFFWDCLADVKSPEAYISGMSLTLEQANLDFTKYYHDLFSKAGDHTSAKILQTVYEDEIRHVQFGLDYLNQTRKNQTLWDYYIAHLPQALNPARAKAKMHFDINGRKSAGMTDYEIMQFKVFNSSKGRSPNIWSFNPGAELEASGITPKKIYQSVQRDITPLMIACTRQDDILVADNISDKNLDLMQNIGLDLPEIISKDKVNSITKKHRPGFITPWGLSPTQAKLFKVIEKKQAPKFKRPMWKENWAQLYSKSHQAKFIKLLANDNEKLDMEAPAIITELDHLKKFNLEEDLVIKAPYSTTGRSCRKIKVNELKENDLAWIKSTLKNQGELTIEPYRKRVADFSAQYQLGTNGHLKSMGLTLIDTDKFANVANTCGPIQQVLDLEVKKFIFKDRQNLLIEAFDLVAKQWADKMITMGFYGAFGLDGFIWESKNQLKFRPICELNPRVTMGRIALELNRICKRGTLSRLSFHSTKKFSNHQNKYTKDENGKLDSADLILTPDALDITAHFEILK